VNATKSISDGILRDFHRRWGKRCLEKSLTSMNELAGRIKGHPESGKFANVLTQMDALKPGIQKELQYLDSLDILKLDQRPASSEREVLEPAK
jgi:hypothetical protein